MAVRTAVVLVSEVEVDDHMESIVKKQRGECCTHLDSPLVVVLFPLLNIQH